MSLENKKLKEQLAAIEEDGTEEHNNSVDLRRKIAALRIKIEKCREVVSNQAENEGLWFNPQTAPEAYLQQELRRLHAVVESNL
jgi:hypothetical protein